MLSKGERIYHVVLYCINYWGEVVACQRGSNALVKGEQRGEMLNCIGGENGEN